MSIRFKRILAVLLCLFLIAGNVVAFPEEEPDSQSVEAVESIVSSMEPAVTDQVTEPTGTAEETHALSETDEPVYEENMPAETLAASNGTVSDSEPEPAALPAADELPAKTESAANGSSEEERNPAEETSIPGESELPSVSPDEPGIPEETDPLSSLPEESIVPEETAAPAETASAEPEESLEPSAAPEETAAAEEDPEAAEEDPEAAPADEEAEELSETPQPSDAPEILSLLDLPEFRTGYCRILPGGADLYAAAGEDSDVLLTLRSGVVYTFSRKNKSADRLQAVLSVPSGETSEIQIGWIDAGDLIAITDESELESYLEDCRNHPLHTEVESSDSTLYLLPCDVKSAEPEAVTPEEETEPAETPSVDETAEEASAETSAQPESTPEPSENSPEESADPETVPEEIPAETEPSEPTGQTADPELLPEDSLPPETGDPAADTQAPENGDPSADGAAETPEPAGEEEELLVPMAAEEGPSIQIALKRDTLGIGEKLKLGASIEGSPDAAFTYTSSNPKLLTVTSAGLIRGVKAGEAVITIQSSTGLIREIAFTVMKAPSSVKISLPFTTLGVGESVQSVVALSSGSAGAVTYSSGNKSIFTVDSEGRVTAAGVGSATLKVKTFNDRSASVRITVKAAPTALTADTEGFTMSKGDCMALHCSLNAGSAGQIYYESDRPDIVEVDETGSVRSIEAGNAVISVYSYNHLCGITIPICVSSKPITGLTIAGRTTIGLSESVRLKAVFEPGEITGSLKWTSSASKYVTVSQNGTIKGVKTGSAVITATAFNGISASVSITVKKAPSSIDISYLGGTMGVGENGMLNIKLSSGSAGGCTITSSDSRIISVSDSGTLTAVGTGTCSIRAVTYNSKKSKTIKITVKNAPESLTLNRETLSIAKNDHFSLKAALNEGAGGAIFYESSDPSIAAVNPDGTVSGIQEGSAVITVRSYNDLCQASCAVTVGPEPVSVKLPSGITLGVGETFTPEVILEPSGTEGTYTWKSSSSCATVSSAGLIKAVRTGTATIRVTTFNGLKAEMKVTVLKAPTSVKLVLPRTAVGVGETLQTEVRFPNGCTGSISSYISENPEIASIDGNGKITAVKAGTTRFIAKTYNGKTSSPVTLQITPAPTAIYPDFYSRKLVVGDSAILGYKFNDNRAGSAIFLSSDSQVVTVDEDGKLTAVSSGEASILVRSYNRSALAMVNITVSGTLDDFSLTGAPSDNLMGVGEKIRLALTSQTAKLYGGITWTSSASKTASVSADGIVTALKTGTVTIKAVHESGAAFTQKLTIKKAPSSVRLNASRTVLGVGETIETTFTLSSGSAGAITEYLSSNESVLKIDENGVVTAVAPGTAKIMCQTFNKKKSNTVSFTIRKAPVSISFSMDRFVIAQSDTVTVSASLSPDSAGMILYSIDDPSVAQVDEETGAVKGLAKGTTTLRARTYKAGLEASVPVEVLAAPDSLTLDVTSLKLGKGDTYTIRPIIPEGTFTTFTYSSTKGNAKVSAGGVITASYVGKSAITVKTHNGLKATINVTIVNAPDYIKFQDDKMKIGLGESVKLNPSITYGTASTLFYETSDDSILQVDSATGEVYAAGVGTAKIRVTTHNGKRAIVTISVLPPPVEIRLEETELLMCVGEKHTIAYSLLPEDASQAVRFSVVSGSSVTVSDSGEIRAAAKGFSTVRVSTYNDLLYRDISVEVRSVPTFLRMEQSSYTVSTEETLQLEPIIDEGAFSTFTYTIKKNGYFTIDENGLLTPVSRGTTTVTITTGNKLSTTVSITIVDPYFPESMRLDSNPPESLRAGSSWTPTIVCTPSSARPSVKWTSSDDSIISVSSSGVITAVSYGRATITGVSERNPELSIYYSINVLNDSRTLSMPAVRVDISDMSSSQVTSAYNTTLSKINSVKSSAIAELQSLRATGEISSSEQDWRKAIINRAFNMQSFAWTTSSTVAYWKNANDEGGRKKFYPGILYFGLPYTQKNRLYNESNAVSSGYYTTNSNGTHKMVTSKFAEHMYAGSDCSSFVSMAIWGLGTSNSGMSSSEIYNSTSYKTNHDVTNMYPGDVIVKNGHVAMFLYYTNESHSQFCIIEQGGGGGDVNDGYSNTITCAIKQASYYASAYITRRPKK